MTVDKLHAAIFDSKLFYGQIRKEINIPIMISIFTDYKMRGLLWDVEAP